MRNQAYSPRYIGYQKVEALEDMVFSHYEREIHTIYERVESIFAEKKMPYDFVIDCFDNYAARRFLQAKRELHITQPAFHLLHIGFSEKMTFEISWDEGYAVPSDITSGFDICTEPGAGSFIRMVAALGSQVAQAFLTSGAKREFLGNKFAITEIS